MYRLHYAPDNASLIVRLVLEELLTPYETVLVDRARNAHKSAAFLTVNPMGLIPALETPDGPMFETGAILLWLSDRHGGLAPTPGSHMRAAFLSWLFAVSNGLHTDMRQLFYGAQYAPGDLDGHRALTVGRVRAHLDRLEVLATAEHAWFAAAAPSGLDLYVGVLLRWLALFPKGRTDWFTLSDWPSLHKLAARLETRPSMQAAQQAEGLGPTPLTAPRYATPPEGSAT
ncbi:glutathione S-transferase family protein [Aliiroseovarius subalbicans]|uniref:glutathione S-transferase family protein n=1 Tax=Aliiroseovarius subalbicans TaxID=2925840 RepID=UPI001F55EA9F|nr:glutathione S-transferase family protein [Aliiroseovarius subalbicans]MCI2397915.1 glutathione S-transferase family protein [Aliiroseovarius subalbicans]